MDERILGSGEGDLNPNSAEEAEVDCARLVEKIQQEDPGGMEDLYRVFSKGIRFYMCRQLGSQELDDKVHDTFLIVVQAIRRGELRESERLMGFVRTVVHRQVAAYIDKSVQVRRDQTDVESETGLADARRNPEESAIARQQQEIMEKILRGISPRDREILIRFYLLEQTQDQICLEMNLSVTQFRLLKSRAKARFGELGRRKMVRTKVSSYFLRNFHRSAH